MSRFVWVKEAPEQRVAALERMKGILAGIQKAAEEDPASPQAAYLWAITSPEAKALLEGSNPKGPEEKD